MKTAEIDDVLARTLEDGRLSRGEKKALGSLFGGDTTDVESLNFIRHRAFAMARDHMSDNQGRQVVDWLEELIKVLNAAPAPDEHPSSTSAAYFSPGDACLKRIIGLIGNARRRADICVFTITDDRIARALRQAHERGVALRIITDNDKANDLGSDVSSLLRAGIPLRVDRSPHHMHHKFAIFDGSVMVTGSYNWTRSAADFNAENLVVTDDVGLLGEFQDVFDGMWTELGAVS